MNAIEFIGSVEIAVQPGQTPLKYLKSLYRIADHYKKCEWCRNCFDSEHYPQPTLRLFINQVFSRHSDIKKWICDYKFSRK